jgi:hypothetical protein
VGVFAAGERDRSGSVAETLRGQNVERLAVRLAAAQEDPAHTGESELAATLASTLSAPFRSDATLVWLGTSGALSPWRGHRLTWTAALLTGRLDSIDVSAGRLVEDVRLSGEAARAAWDVSLPRGVAVSGALLWLSGGSVPEPSFSAGEVVPGTGTYHGFLGIAPLVDHAHLFFGGGLSETFSARRVSAPPVNGHGVLSPAATVTWAPAEVLDLLARVAWLRADVPGPFGGRTYGTEVDLTATFSPVPWLGIGFEVDALRPGDFFGGGATVYKSVLALDVTTP